VLCGQAKTQAQNAVGDFFSQLFFTKQVFNESSFSNQITQELHFVLNTATNRFRQRDQYIRCLIHSNQVQTALQTPREIIKAVSRTGITLPNELIFRTHYFSGAHGFRVGCYPMEALFQSTLECLFDPACIRDLLQNFPNSILHPDSIIPLDRNLTRFSPQDKVETLMNRLFIDQSTITPLYSFYFEKCAPISCTYTFVQTSDALFIFTTITGLLGGIIIALRYVVFFTISFFISVVSSLEKSTIVSSLTYEILSRR
jgi:hypothetical protein